MNTVHFWEQLVYSLAGLVVGFVAGRYWPQRRPRQVTDKQERRVASRRVEDGKRDIPRLLTIFILVMMVLTVGGVVQNTISQNHLRDQRRADIYRQLSQTGAIAKNAEALAERVKTDEGFLSQLVVTISKAKTPADVSRAIHKFIKQSRKEDSKPLPGVPPTSSSTTPVTPPSSSHPHPTYTPVSAPRPINTHPPPRHPLPRKPTPNPVVPEPVPIPTHIPGPKCLDIPFLGPVICRS